jgi:very-short-patch-repair endonuclease
MISTSIRRAAAKKLRANTTPHERILWRALKELPVDGTHFGDKLRSVPMSRTSFVQPLA